MKKIVVKDLDENSIDENDVTHKNSYEEIIKKVVKVCTICKKDAIYICPACNATTCSLECYNEHKKKFSCDGKCKKFEIKPISKFTTDDIRKDISFLESGVDMLEKTQIKAKILSGDQHAISKGVSFADSTNAPLAGYGLLDKLDMADEIKQILGCDSMSENSYDYEEEEEETEETKKKRNENNKNKNNSNDKAIEDQKINIESDSSSIYSSTYSYSYSSSSSSSSYYYNSSYSYSTSSETDEEDNNYLKKEKINEISENEEEKEGLDEEKFMLVIKNRKLKPIKKISMQTLQNVIMSSGMLSNKRSYPDGIIFRLALLHKACFDSSRNIKLFYLPQTMEKHKLNETYFKQDQEMIKRARALQKQKKLNMKKERMELKQKKEKMLCDNISNGQKTNELEDVNCNNTESGQQQIVELNELSSIKTNAKLFKENNTIEHIENNILNEEKRNNNVMETENESCTISKSEFNNNINQNNNNVNQEEQISGEILWSCGITIKMAKEYTHDTEIVKNKNMNNNKIEIINLHSSVIHDLSENIEVSNILKFLCEKDLTIRDELLIRREFNKLNQMCRIFIKGEFINSEVEITEYFWPYDKKQEDFELENINSFKDILKDSAIIEYPEIIIVLFSPGCDILNTTFFDKKIITLKEARDLWSIIKCDQLQHYQKF